MNFFEAKGRTTFFDLLSSLWHGVDGLFITLFLTEFFSYFLIFFIRTVIKNGQGTTFTLKIKASVTPVKVSAKYSSFKKAVRVDLTENEAEMAQ